MRKVYFFYDILGSVCCHNIFFFLFCGSISDCWTHKVKVFINEVTQNLNIQTLIKIFSLIRLLRPPSTDHKSYCFICSLSVFMFFVSFFYRTFLNFNANFISHQKISMNPTQRRYLLTHQNQMTQIQIMQLTKKKVMLLKLYLRLRWLSQNI